jgi:undecaprenyl-diphosphatase
VFASLLTADRAVGVWLATHLASPWLDQLMVWASIIGARGGLWVVAGAITLIAAPKKRMAAFRLLLSITLAGLLVDDVVKPIVGRVRPYVDHPEYRELGVRPEDPSFPSGHAATAAAGAVALTRMWPGPATVAIAWPLAIIIAISRIALGVHFPSDVVMGFAIGFATARVVCAKPPHHQDGAAREPDRVVHTEAPVL